MTEVSLTPFFDPKGVVLVGVSREPTKLGFGLARNLIQSGYGGAIHLVNPKGGQLFGHTIYPTIAAVPDPADLAVLLAPPNAIPEALRACGERGICAAIIASGGFRETGPDGAALEAQCLAIARQYGMRLIGPNCIGLIYTYLPLDTTFLEPPPPPAGDIAFISHSGAICAAVIDWVRGQGLGLSSLISLGNQVDVNETDMLAPVAAERRNRVICLYMEGVSNGRRFVTQARQVAVHKPILALKVGRFESGQRAAASHTGALAGSEAAFDAGFQQAGVIRANTTEEMFQWARALAWCPLPKGRNVAVLTNAGGPGVTAADALEANGLRLAPLSQETQEGLQAILPAAASVRNPVDMLASASPEQYASCLQLLLADPQVHSALVITPPPPMHSAGQVARAIIPVIEMSDKPVVMAVMGDRMIQEAVEHLRAAHIAEYRFPEWAASALAILSQRAEFLARAGETPLEPEGVDRPRAERLLADRKPGEWLDSEVALELLEAYGLRSTRLELASSATQAVEIAERMGYPVVLKIASPDISHKSDVGGVLLNVRDAQAVKDGYAAMLARVQAACPSARLLGLHVQRMLPQGQETIVGVVCDPQFGPLVMFGSGGTEVEGMNDVAFGLAPLAASDVDRMLAHTWAGRKLKGFRNLPPADRSAVQDALVRLAQLALDFPQIAEIEINPLRVLAEGQGAYAVDVRAKIAGA